MKKVILTGATGLIGKEVVELLKLLGFEVCTEYFDLFNSRVVEEIFEKVRPEYLLHFAWVASGDYLTSDLNYKLKDASLDMLKIFKKYGGKRAVFAGTCFEYEFKDTPLKENDKLNPTTIYAKCKNELHMRAQKFATKNDISFGWGRIFYVFGHGENEKRLTAHVINSLRENKKVVITSGSLIRDYMYTKDIAGAFAKFLDTSVDCVNICSGSGIAIRDFVLKIAEKLNKTESIEFADDCARQPPIIVGDNIRLKDEIGFTPKYTLDEALEEILNESRN